MHTFIIAIAVVVIAAGAYVNVSSGNHGSINPESKVEVDVDVLSDQSTGESTIELDDKETESTVTPTTKPSLTVTPTNTPTSQVTESSVILVYRYSGSTLHSQTSTSLKLESHDSDEKITEWYKSVIKSRGMNVTSFVTTKTNGRVLNKLAAESSVSSEHVEVEISKLASSDSVTITVQLK